MTRIVYDSRNQGRRYRSGMSPNEARKVSQGLGYSDRAVGCGNSSAVIYDIEKVIRNAPPLALAELVRTCEEALVADN